MPKKKFIDKNKAVSFQVVHRSQKDPLAVDEDAPQHVLMPMASKQPKSEDKEKRKEQLREAGIYYEDDYDYLQHFKSTNDHDVELQPIERIKIKAEKLSSPSQKASGSGLQLPSNVFASKQEEDVGLLNKAAPMGLRLDWDPEVLAAMDEDFDFEDPDNQLEDNFMELANAEKKDGDEDEYESDEDGSWMDDSDADTGDLNSSEGDSVPSLNGMRMKNEDMKSSRFTEYSMSSSVMKRNDQLTLLDDRFEQMMSGYDENEIGALDCDDIEGTLAADSAIVMKCADEFAKQKLALELERAATKNVAMNQDSDDDDMMDLKVDARAREKWDCESILSTYSNIYNHPKLIPREQSKNAKIKISGKTGLPVGVLGRGLTASALATLDGENRKRDGEEMSQAISILSTLSVRPKDESREDKTARKLALKDYRRERRVERKANKLAFKEETMKQQKLEVRNKANSNTVKIV